MRKMCDWSRITNHSITHHASLVTRHESRTMPFTKYTKWTGVDLDALSLEDLLDRLADFLLQSGYRESVSRYWDEEQERTLEALRNAIMRALMDELLSDEELEALSDERGELNERSRLRVARSLDRAAYRRRLHIAERRAASRRRQETGLTSAARANGPARRANVKFEMTDKGLDFLGFKALKELIASLGKSSLGRHETNQLSTGIEASEASRRTSSATRSTWMSTRRLIRDPARRPRRSDQPRVLDLMVHQTEYQSSCATVLMLDCSHSMILYGEDRFTPAKRVALASDASHPDSVPGRLASRRSISRLGRRDPIVGGGSRAGGPYHTNTREGLRLARRILMSQRKDMRQIIMITDGKPSAMTLKTDEFTKTRWVWTRDPARNLSRSGACRRSGIMINTFMLADDYYLVDFVKKSPRSARVRRTSQQR